MDPTSKIVGKRLFGQIQFLDAERQEYAKLFRENIKHSAEIRALATIPGISSVRANIIAAAVCDAKRFSNKNKFWSYCMLVKHDQQSDGKSYGKVTIFGKMSLKNVFMGAALTVIQNGGVLKEFYEEQKAKGLDHRAARKNLARKIAAIALSVMRTGQSYEEKKVVNEKSNLV